MQAIAAGEIAWDAYRRQPERLLAVVAKVKIPTKAKGWRRTPTKKEMEKAVMAKAEVEVEEGESAAETPIRRISV